MSTNEDRSMLEKSDENEVPIRHPNQIQLQFSNSYIGGIVIDNQNIQGQGDDAMTSGVTLEVEEREEEEEREEREEEEEEGDDGDRNRGDFDGVVVRCRDIEIIHHEDVGESRDRSRSGSEGGFSSIPNQHSHLHHHNRHQHSVYSRKSHHSNSFLLPRSSITDICPLSICPMNSSDCSSSLSPIRRSSIRASPPGGKVSMTMQMSPKESLTGTTGTDRSGTTGTRSGTTGTRSGTTGTRSGSIEEQEDCDRVDSLPKDMSFTWIDIIAILFSICSFLFDITTDTIVAAFHLKNGDKWYFILTTVFIVVPTLVMTGISLRWYVLDAREEGSPKISPWKWFTRTLFLLLQLGPILRYVDSLIYGLKFRRHKANKLEQKKYYQYMVYEDTDATMLRLFECFMEAAPQLVLQLYILARKTASNDPTLLVMTQVTAVFASLVSLGWSLVSYHRALRMSLQDKINMTWQGMAFQFLWRICVIGARVLALAMFAARYQQYIALVCGVHWLVMFVWIISMRTTFCDNRCEELGYNAVLGVMFIFCYFNPVDSPTRYRYSFFYSFMFLENTLLMTLFFIHPDSIHSWYRLPAMIGHFLAFFLGLSFMITYYLAFHPTQAIKIFRSNQEDRNSEIQRKLEARKGGYKRQTSCNLWMNQGRVLHPRPAVPAITSTHSCSEINMLEHIISPGMHSDTKHSPRNGNGHKRREENEKRREENEKRREENGRKKEENEKRREENEKRKEENGRKREENGKKKTTLFASLIKSPASSASRTESKSRNESHEKYKATDPDELIPPQMNRGGNDPHYKNVLSSDGQEYKNVLSSDGQGYKNVLSSDGQEYKNVLSSDGQYKNVSNGRSTAAFVTESSGEPC